MNLVRTPAELEKSITGKGEENESFVKKMQHIEVPLFDSIFSSVLEKVEAQIDCTTCANCCKKFHMALPDAEIERLASLKKMDLKDFKDNYTTTEAKRGITFLKLNPCTFLRHDNLCSIYSQRPEVCRNYPKLPTSDNIKIKLQKVMYNYAICPIIYNTVEILKRDIDSLLQ